MKKQLLLAVVAVAGLSLMPEAEARRGRCGKSCAPAPRECAPACTVKDVGRKLITCCRMVKEEGYQVCPIEEKCCRRTRCCKERTSCCIFPGDKAFSQSELEEAHGRTEAESVMMTSDVD
jgi:hypothetical protein